MTTRTLLAVLLFAAACNPEPTYEPWEDPGNREAFYDADAVPELDLKLDDGAIDSLRENPREYVPGYIVWDGLEYGPVGVRLKGQNSFQTIDEKPSFRINVDEFVEGVTFMGVQDMTWNNMSSDPSQMHEVLAYRFAREAGLPASLANHVWISVNGEPYGLYTNLETVKPRMVKHWFDDNNGPMYKATDVDFASQYVDLYEHESGDDDRTLIAGLASALANADADRAIRDAGAYVDMEHFQRYWAMETVIGQFDAFPYSLPGDDYYLYADPTSGKLWFIPGGMDETFFAADFSPMNTNSVFAAKCKESAGCFDAYVETSWNMVDLAEQIDMNQIRARLEERIEPYVQDDPRRPFTDAEVNEGQTQLGYFIQFRRQTLGNFLPPPTPVSQL
jgi:spore coat protein CotH